MLAVDPNPLAHAWWWIEVHTGTSGKPPAYYGFWSGFGSDLGEVTLTGAVAAAAISFYRHHKCTTCRRIGKHKTEDTAQRFCHHHWTREHVDAARRKHRLKFPHNLAHNKQQEEV